MPILKQGSNLIKQGTHLVKAKDFPDCSEFYTYAEILELVREGDKLGLVIRHSQKDTTRKTELSVTGEEWCEEIGDILAEKYTTGETTYFSSNATRAKNTADIISQRIGDNVGPSNVNISLANDILNSYFFISGTNSSGINITFDHLSAYSYCDSAELITLLDNTGKTITDIFGCGATDAAIATDINLKASTITTKLIQSMTSNLNIFVTHDNVLWPYVVTISGQQLAMRWYDGDRQAVNYLSGVAIIKHSDGTVELYPIGTSYSDS